MKVTVKSESYGVGREPHEAVKQIDWNNSSDRKWLMNHLHWAMNNRTGVKLWPTESN